MQWSLLIAVILVFVAVAALGIWVGGGVVRARASSTTSRLAVYGRANLRDGTLREQTLRRPMVERAIAPIFLGAGRVFGRFTPSGFVRRTQRKLVLAGVSRSLDPNGWVVVKVMLVVAGVAMAALALSQVNGLMRFVLAALSILAGILLPDAWLQRRIEARRVAMRNSLLTCSTYSSSASRPDSVSIQHWPGWCDGPWSAFRGVLPDAPGDEGRRQPARCDAAPA